MRNLIDILGS